MDQTTPLAHPTNPTPNPQNTSPGEGSSLLWVMLVIISVALIGSVLGIWYFFNQTTTPKPVIGVNLKRVLDQGEITFGMDATFAPMEYINDQGEVVGYDVDLANKIGEELGVTVKIKNIRWEDVFSSLENKTIDVAISGITINEKRQADYAFSDPYINAGQVIITQDGNTTITGVTDLQGKKIAVQQDTTNEEEAFKYTTTDMVMSFPTFEDATAALVAGAVDAIFSDLTNAKGIIEENPGLKIASAPFTSEYYGIAFRKDETDLVERVNEILDALRQQGYLVYLQQKWLD